jgi:hypothetical protein
MPQPALKLTSHHLVVDKDHPLALTHILLVQLVYNSPPQPASLLLLLLLGAAPGPHLVLHVHIPPHLS